MTFASRTNIQKMDKKKRTNKLNTNHLRRKREYAAEAHRICDSQILLFEGISMRERFCVHGCVTGGGCMLAYASTFGPYNL